jgi:hypothetical protein
MDGKKVAVTILPDGRMTRPDASRYLGLSTKTLAMYAVRGIGPKFIKRGRVFYFQKDLDEWMNAGQMGGHRM